MKVKKTLALVPVTLVLLLFARPALAVTDFSFGSVVKSVTKPAGVVVADFNEDGNPDLLTGSELPAENLRFYAGNGSGGLTNTWSYSNPEKAFWPSGASAVDFNKDGHLDVVLERNAWMNEAYYEVWLGDGSGHFAYWWRVWASQTPYAGAPVPSDMNGDNKMDLVAYEADTPGRHIATYFGDGTGHFPTWAHTDIAATAYQVRTGRLDKKGPVDIAYLESANLVTMSGKGNGAFDTRRAWPLGGTPLQLRVGDADRDHDMDLFVLVDAGGSVTLKIFRNDGTGAFTLWKTLDLAVAPPADMRLADLDRDGGNEVVVAVNGQFRCVRYAYTSKQPLIATNYSFTGGLALADFDKDGRVDVLTADPVSDTVSVRLNTTLGSKLLTFPPSSPPSYNTAFTVSAILADSAGFYIGGQTVQLAPSTDGGLTWSLPFSQTSDAFGSVYFTGLKIRQRTVFWAWYGGDVTRTPTSKEFTVKPRHYLTSPRAPSEVARYVTFKVYGFLGPKHAKGASTVRLFFEQYVNGHYVQKKTVYAYNADYSSMLSKYYAKTSLPAGRWRVRAAVSDDWLNASKISGYDYITVN